MAWFKTPTGQRVLKHLDWTEDMADRYRFTRYSQAVEGEPEDGSRTYSLGPKNLLALHTREGRQYVDGDVFRDYGSFFLFEDIATRELTTVYQTVIPHPDYVVQAEAADE